MDQKIANILTTTTTTAKKIENHEDHGVGTTRLISNNSGLGAETTGP